MSPTTDTHHTYKLKHLGHLVHPGLQRVIDSALTRHSNILLGPEYASSAKHPLYAAKSYWQARFIYDYDRYLDGLIDDEAMDDVLSTALIRVSIPLMNVIHPNLRAGELIKRLVDERLPKTQLEKLKARADESNITFIKMKYDDMDVALGGVVIQTLASISMPMAIALGGQVSPKRTHTQFSHQESPLKVGAKELRSVIKNAVGDMFSHELSADFLEQITSGFFDHFLIGYPELWPDYGVDASHFLGAPMLGGGRVAKGVYRGPAGKSMVRVGRRFYPQGLSGLCLDYLVGLDPCVLDAKHLLLDGSRAPCWVNRCKGLNAATGKVRQLVTAGIDHPALDNLLDLPGMLDRKSREAALRNYLNRGGKAKQRIAKKILVSNPELAEWAFKICDGHRQLTRLDSINPLSKQQLLQVTPTNRRKILASGLEI